MNAAQSNLPKWLQAKVNSCPKSPLGVHPFLFNVSRHLHRHLERGQIETLLADAVKNCGRAVPEKEIKSAVNNSIATAWKPSQ